VVRSHASLPRRIAARARRIRALVLDVDGVLTDGRMVLSERGDELKGFHTHDGLAINFAKRAGLRVAFVTGEKATIAQHRGSKLGVDEILLGVRRKGDAVDALCARWDLTSDQVAYMGDDLIDIPALERVGLAMTVADAVAEVRAAAHVVMRARGGHGAVREAVELILRAQGRWGALVEEFVREHGGTGAGRRRR
jgi:3-deoxy-D-manno-octulosonate 8-phosphate phosphatase (KDO 8-P phosphatase)